MAFERGRFGIEYDLRQREREHESSGLGWVFVLVAVVAVASFVWTKFIRSDGEDEMPPVAPPVPSAVAPSTPTPSSPEAEPSTPPQAQVPEDKPQPPPTHVSDASIAKRPVKVRNLLMRLDEAARRKDIDMAVSTIEQLRALPGSPAADLDDSLARRLGVLNVKRLFELKNAQWVKTVVVKRGDAASRIAAENGSTLASLARLNGGNVDKIAIGRKLYVMDHPRFNLVIHRRTRTADLSLNGKFFRRYDLDGEVSGEPGAYEMTANPRAVWRALGVSFKPADRTELETLLPSGAQVLVSEL